MSLRLPAAPTTLVFLLLLAVHGRAADFVDSTERYVAVPDRIGRVMPADQSAAVLIYVLARRSSSAGADPCRASSGPLCRPSSRACRLSASLPSRTLRR